MALLKKKSEAEKIQEKERERIHKEMLKSADESRKDDKQCDPNVFVSLQHINKIYDNHVQAVYDFNLDIKQNEFIVLVGPSGCGKSTTLRMVAGLEDITFGDLYIDGLYANDLAPKDRDIAMVFQSYALYPHMTVYNNIAFGLKIRKAIKPVYEPCPQQAEFTAQIAAINNEIKALEKEAAQALAADNKAKADELNAVIEGKNAEVEVIKKQAQDALVQVVDFDPAKVKEYEKELVLIDKEIAKTKDIIAKAGDDNDKIIRMNAKIASLEELKEKDLERVEYYKTNKVPIFKVRKLTKEEIDVEVKKAAKILDLTEYLDRKPAALSGGQRQRVALGRAIVRNSKLFLMDEPLSNLDAKLRVQMRSEIVKLHKGLGKTTIYVTHDQTEAMTMATRIVVMSKGYVQQIGAPKEIYNKPNNIFVATFIGSPAMNIFPIRYENGLLHVSEEYTLKLDEKFVKAHDEFYEAKAKEYTAVIADIEKDLALYEEYKQNPDATKLTRAQQINFKNAYYAKAKEVELEDRKQKLAKFEEISQSKDHMIMFGVRPEDIFRTVDKTDLLRLSDPFKATVVVPELLGREYYVHYEMGGHQYVAKISSGDDIMADDILDLAFNLDSIHLFDEVTTELIDKNI